MTLPGLVGFAVGFLTFAALVVGFAFDGLLSPVGASRSEARARRRYVTRFKP